MKRILSLILVSIVLLSLCACGKKSNQNIEPNTTNTEESTDNTTETTQATIEESTTAHTVPATKPAETQTTTPTTCNHSYKDATCTAPKTCAKCGATSGSVAGHKYQDATCTHCQTITLTSCHWYLTSTYTDEYEDPPEQLLDRICIRFMDNWMSASHWGTKKRYYNPITVEYNGVPYYYMGFGSGSEMSFTTDGDKITISYGNEVLTLARTGENTLTVVSVSDSLPFYIEVGDIFTNQKDDLLDNSIK